MRILGLETSCDETAAAVIEANPQDTFVKLRANVVSTSLQLHAKTGGIIPEIAAREQIKYILPVIEQTLKKAHMSTTSPDIDAIGVTYGPGLIGSLLVGVETAKTLSFLWNKPLIPVNHLMGHIFANFIENNTKKIQNTVRFPALALIVSGGHTDLVLMKSYTNIKLLGGTRDDAAGECFDKCARILGFAYPGGQKIAELAQKGNSHAFHFPRPMIGSHDFDFSFSGLKTAFINQVTALKHINSDITSDLCASLEQAIVDVLVRKTVKAAHTYKVKSILLGGGVAANTQLRTQLYDSIRSQATQTDFFIPEKQFCTDNGAMIATAAFFINKPIPWYKLRANPELYFS